MPAYPKLRHGPYSVQDARVLVRVDSVTDLEATFTAMSTQYPVTFDFGDEEDPVVSATGEAVVYEYGGADTYTVTVTNAYGGSDTVDVTVTAP